jgi:hypothetical protein
MSKSEQLYVSAAAVSYERDAKQTPQLRRQRVRSDGRGVPSTQKHPISFEFLLAFW